MQNKRIDEYIIQILQIYIYIYHVYFIKILPFHTPFDLVSSLNFVQDGVQSEQVEGKDAGGQSVEAWEHRCNQKKTPGFNYLAYNI